MERTEALQGRGSGAFTSESKIFKGTLLFPLFTCIFVWFFVLLRSWNRLGMNDFGNFEIFLREEKSLVCNYKISH